MGIVKIADELHEEIRKASSVMSRSINAQAEILGANGDVSRAES